MQFSFLCVIHNFAVFAQFSTIPNQVTLTGKVFSSEIYQVLGDSSNKVYELIKKSTFDAKGRALLTYQKEDLSKFHVYNKNKETIYTCYECDTNTLMDMNKTFKAMPKQHEEVLLGTDEPDYRVVIINTRNRKDSLVRLCIL